MNTTALDLLQQINMLVLKMVEENQVLGYQKTSTFRDLYAKAFNDTALSEEVSVVDLAIQGDRKARATVKNIIFNIIAAKSKNNSLKIKEDVIDKVLEGYYINYYGTADDIATPTGSHLLINKVNKILIRKDSPYEVKLKKLAQVIYQECFGLGILDEFLDLGVDENFKKVEEVGMAGPNQIYLKISGCNFKLDKLYYPMDEIIKITTNLSRRANKALSRNNCKVETDLLDGSRVTLTCPPLAANYTFTVRLHYAGTLTIAKQVELRSTTWEFQGFLDNIMLFRPRILVIGGQGTGKTTDIREIVKRYPANTSVVTAETSFELELDKIKHLIVNKLRLGSVDIEKLLEIMFRLNADSLILGEAREPSDVMFLTQAAKRTQYGTVSTWHEDNAINAIYDMANGLVRKGFFKTLGQALEEVTKSVEIVITKKVTDSTSAKEGLRHTAEVCEVLKYKDGVSKEVETRVLFEYDYKKWTMIQRNTISDDYAEELLRRVPNPGAMEALKSGKFN